MAKITTVELSREKLIELLTPIFRDYGALDNKDKIVDFMVLHDENDRFESISVVMAPKSTKAVPLKKSLKFTWEYNIPKNRIKDARWEQELFRTIYTVCIKASNELGNRWDGTPGKREYLEADAMTIACLQSLEQFEIDDGPNRFGTIGRFNVFRNLEALDNYIYITGVNGDARIELDFSKMPKAKMK